MRFTLFCALLSFGPLVAFAQFETISFSPVRQCGNFTVSFAGGKLPSSLPLTLTVVPLNGTPISIGIPDSDWDSNTLTGAAITFLPFPTGTDFVASLDDANGISSAQVSNVIRVDVSDDASCVSTNTTEQRYTADSSPSQCEPFDVHFAPNVVSAPPTVRAFVPQNISTLVNLTSTADVSSGKASYTMDVPEGQQVVLMFSDNTGLRQSTDLLVVEGNLQNPTSCLPTNIANFGPTTMVSQMASAATTSGTKGSLSKGAAIAIGVVSGCVVGAMTIAMALWLNRERRRAGLRTLKMVEASDEKRRDDRWRLWRNDGSGTGERRTSTLAVPQRQDALSLRVMKDPLYTQDIKFEPVTPTSAVKRTADPADQQDATGSTPISAIPIPLTTPLPLITTEPPIDITPNAADVRAGRTQADPVLSSADIETILDTARLFTGSDTSLPDGRTETRSSVKPSPSMITAASSAALPSAALPKPPTPVLLTPPNSAETYREPPQAPLPSSALPSPAGDGSFRITSMTSSDARLVAQNLGRISRGLSGFSFFGSRETRASNTNSFLAM